MDKLSDLNLTNLNHADLLTNPFVEGRTYELTVGWPSGKRLTYLARTAEQYEHLNQVVEKAVDLKSECSIRCYNSTNCETIPCETFVRNNSLSTEKLKLSSRAVDQFYRMASEPLQAAVEARLSRDPAAVEAVHDLIKPYTAYRVQALSADEGGKTLAVDFDGVCAAYEPGQFPEIGEPLPGAIEALQELVDKGFKVVIMSTRAMSAQGKSDIQDWLDAHGAPEVTVTGNKIPAEVYLDDRALRFTDWKSDLPKLLDLVEGKEAESALCPFDKSILERKGSKLVCPACDKELDILQTVSASTYSFIPGDKVHVKAMAGRTLGDAYLICKASKKEEYSLQGADLWLVKFASGECLPVGESYLAKIGHDMEIQKAAEAVALGDENRLSKVASMSVRYDLDNVVESALKEAQEGVMPLDAVLVSVGAKHNLSPDDLDFVAEQLLNTFDKDAEKQPLDLTDSVRDALLEAEAQFSREGTVPSEDDEVNLVLGYVAEEYDLKAEAMDGDLETKVKDLILNVRQADNRIPLWVSASNMEKFRGLISSGFVSGLNKFRTAEMEDYHPTNLPSLTSIPESEYDTVRQQTTAEGDLCLNCGSTFQEGVRCCDNPRKAPAEGPAMRGEVKEAYEGDVCSSCGKFVPMHDAIKTDNGYVCSTCNEAKKEAPNLEPVTAGKDTSFQRGDAYVMQFLEGIEIESDKEVSDILSSNDSEEVKYDKILARAKAMFSELSDADATIKQVDWDEPQIKADIQQMIWDAEESKKESESGLKKEILTASLKDVTLNDEQKKVVASITQYIDEFTPDFLRSVGQFFTYDWDQGSSWEVKEVEGKKQIVRKEVISKKEVPQGKHAFKEGQIVKSYLSFFPSEVKIVALLGEDRYRVKSTLDGTVSEVSEDDILIDDPQKGLFN